MNVENSSYALVLTGDVLPGFATESVWPALAAYFRMEPEKFNRLLGRAPLAIKQSDDLGKLHTLQAGIAAVGAEAEVCAPDGRPGLFVLLDNAPRGPVPRVFVEERVEHGLWPNDLTVAEVGSNVWRAFTEFAAPASVEPDPVPAPEFAANAFATTDRASGHAPTLPADHGRALAGVAVQTLAETPLLPPGATIHAGFWRRCAAMLIDSVLVGIAVMLVQAIFGVAALGGNVSALHAGALVGAMMTSLLIAFVAEWLYFALFESASLQATPGKLAMGLKVVDDTGRRIAFGRASGRYFGKSISGLILGIGFLMAGWTTRKQALHDMMAGTLVVFRAVESGQPLPEVRPPMPWYGWLLNILLVGGGVLALIGFWMFAASMADLASGALQDGSGF